MASHPRPPPSSPYAFVRSVFVRGRYLVVSVTTNAAHASPPPILNDSDTPFVAPCDYCESIARAPSGRTCANCGARVKWDPVFGDLSHVMAPVTFGAPPTLNPGTR